MKKKNHKNSSSGLDNSAQKLFMTSALSMSWQLAIAVLVPLIAGLYIDDHFKTTPLWTLIGLIVGVAMAVVVVWRAVVDFNSISSNKNINTKNKVE